MICVCINLIPTCNIRNLHHNLMPGQPFKIHVVAVGQWNGVVPVNIQLQFREGSPAKVNDSQYIQSAGRKCTEFVYRFTSMREYDSIHLQTITTNRIRIKQKKLFIEFFLQNCTLGFLLDNKSMVCVCNKELTNQGIECDIETLTIKRLSPKWINATFEHLPPSRQSGSSSS